MAEHFSAREINSLLNDVIKHTAADSSSIVSIDSASSGATSDSSLKSVILCRVVATGSRSILAMDSIQPLIQSIRDPDVRVSVSRTILQSCCVQQQQLLLEQESETEAETVDRQRWHPDDEQWLDVLHTLSFCCRTVHDSVSAISLEDERREVANLLTGYLRLVTFCPVLDREQRFTLLQDARSDYFAKMDSVLSFLVYAVNSLIAPSSNSCEPPSRHFVRSCLAFAFTTIPSIDDPVSKLLLYAQSAEMGLANAALSQLDSFLKAGMQLLSQQSGNTVVVSDSFFASYCRKLLSLLLVVPDHPDHEPLYLLKGLVAVVSGHDFQSEEVRFLLRLDLMCFLSVASQSEYPVHADGVDSNDVLYGGCESGEERAAFVTTVTSLMRETMDQLLQHLTPGQGPAAGAGQGSSGDKGQEDVDEAWMRRADLCLHLFTRLVTFSDLSRSHKLATRLWHLMRKQHGDNGDRGKVRSGGTPFQVSLSLVNDTVVLVLVVVLTPCSVCLSVCWVQVRMREAIKSCPDRELRERITSQ